MVSIGDVKHRNLATAPVTNDTQRDASLRQERCNLKAERVFPSVEFEKVFFYVHTT